MKEMLLINVQFVKLSLHKKGNLDQHIATGSLNRHTYFISSPGNILISKDALPESEKKSECQIFIQP